MMTRWWWMALGAVGMLAVQAWSAQEPARHWIERNGTDWGRMGHDAQTAYVEGFLAGAALGQAAEQACSQQELRAQRQGCEWAGDSAGLTRTLGERRRSGGFRFPYGANVYASRISDYYWWHNHRPLPIWYAFWEVNAVLTRPQ
jgi:hypothetical protein